MSKKSAALIVGLVFLVSIAVTSSRAEASIITNGDFNTPSGGGSFITLGVGSPALTGWSIDQGSIDVIGQYWTNPSGSQSVDLDGTPGAAKISQELKTGIGTYQLTFLATGNPEGDPSRNKLLRVWLGASSQDFIIPIATSKTQMDWQPYTLTFNATGPVKLSFESLTGTPGYGGSVNINYCGPVVADVKVSPVPIPGAVWLLGSGLLGLLGLRRKSLG